MTTSSQGLAPTRARIAVLQDELLRLRKVLAEGAASRAEELPSTVSLLLALCGTLGIGIDARRSLEVIPRVALDPLAEPLPHVLGLMRFRGTLVPVMDLCARLGATNRVPTLAQRIILVESPLGLRGLLVSETVDVVSMARGDLVPLPPDSALLGVGLANLQIASQMFTALDLDAIFSEAAAAS